MKKSLLSVLVTFIGYVSVCFGQVLSPIVGIVNANQTKNILSYQLETTQLDITNTGTVDLLFFRAATATSVAVSGQGVTVTGGATVSVAIRELGGTILDQFVNVSNTSGEASGAYSVGVKNPVPFPPAIPDVCDRQMLVTLTGGIMPDNRPVQWLNNTAGNYYLCPFGNVGIGLRNPAYPLDVIGTGNFTEVRAGSLDLYTGPSWTSTGWKKTIKMISGNSIGFDLPAIKFGIGATSSDNNLYFFTTNGSNFPNYYMQIGQDGLMKINTSLSIGANPNSDYKLSVGGTIRAKKVVVETGWADFVFDKDYQLMPLSEVEKFIEANNHLPEIPSGATVEKGADVGELLKLQMQKIEELTLHMIQQQKEIEALKKAFQK